MSLVVVRRYYLKRATVRPRGLSESALPHLAGSDAAAIDEEKMLLLVDLWMRGGHSLCPGLPHCYVMLEFPRHARTRATLPIRGAPDKAICLVALADAALRPSRIRVVCMAHDQVSFLIRPAAFPAILEEPSPHWL